MNEIIRKELLNHIRSYGIKQVFIARQIGITKSMLCHFLKGRRNLGEVYLKRLEGFFGERVNGIDTFKRSNETSLILLKGDVLHE